MSNSVTECLMYNFLLKRIRASENVFSPEYYFNIARETNLRGGVPA